MGSHLIGIAEGLPAIQLTVRLHLAQLQSLQAQLERVTRAVPACLVSLPETPYLLSVKSLGAVSSLSSWRKWEIPVATRRPPSGSNWPASNPPPTLLGRSSAVRPPCPTRAAPIADPALLYLSAHGTVRSPLRSTLCDFTKEPKNPLTKVQPLGVLMNKLSLSSGRSFIIKPFTIHPSLHRSELCLGLFRLRLYRLLGRMNLPWLPGDTVKNLEALCDLVNELGCPCRLVRSN